MHPPLMMILYSKISLVCGYKVKQPQVAMDKLRNRVRRSVRKKYYTKCCIVFVRW
uniref:Uncharacterized protein n=1 Tax=Ciona intestinalis TaxID=7719 RepID=F6PM28_CIOIN